MRNSPQSEENSWLLSVLKTSLFWHIFLTDYSLEVISFTSSTEECNGKQLWRMMIALECLLHFYLQVTSFFSSIFWREENKKFWWNWRLWRKDYEALPKFLLIFTDVHLPVVLLHSLATQLEWIVSFSSLSLYFILETKARLLFMS